VSLDIKPAPSIPLKPIRQIAVPPENLHEILEMLTDQRGLHEPLDIPHRNLGKCEDPLPFILLLLGPTIHLGIVEPAKCTGIEPFLPEVIELVESVPLPVKLLVCVSLGEVGV